MRKDLVGPSWALFAFFDDESHSSKVFSTIALVIIRMDGASGISRENCFSLYIQWRSARRWGMHAHDDGVLLIRVNVTIILKTAPLSPLPLFDEDRRDQVLLHRENLRRTQRLYHWFLSSHRSQLLDAPSPFANLSPTSGESCTFNEYSTEWGRYFPCRRNTSFARHKNESAELAVTGLLPAGASGKK